MEGGENMSKVLKLQTRKEQINSAVPLASTVSMSCYNCWN